MARVRDAVAWRKTKRDKAISTETNTEAAKKEKKRRIRNELMRACAHAHLRLSKAYNLMSSKR